MEIGDATFVVSIGFSTPSFHPNEEGEGEVARVKEEYPYTAKSVVPLGPRWREEVEEDSTLLEGATTAEVVDATGAGGGTGVGTNSEILSFFDSLFNTFASC